MIGISVFLLIAIDLSSDSTGFKIYPEITIWLSAFDFDLRSTLFFFFFFSE